MTNYQICFNFVIVLRYLTKLLQIYLLEHVVVKTVVPYLLSHGFVTSINGSFSLRSNSKKAINL